MATSHASATATSGVAGRSPATRSAGRSLRGRLLTGLLIAASATLQRLPDAPLHVLAHAAGYLVYAVQPRRRALVRSNLRRVCAYVTDQRLAATDSPATRGARDARALERLVRSAFGHYVRSYLETAIVAGYATGSRLSRIQPDDPALVAEALGLERDRPTTAIVIGLHFGAIELPALWATRHGVPVTAPMETIDDPALQAYLERSRGASGVRLIPIAGASGRLVDCLSRGEVVALVADRVVAGTGARVQLFGGPARLPVGPAVLALQSGAPTWLVAVRRTGWGHYRAHIEPIVPPVGGTRRQWLHGFLDAQARAYERAIARAPEQWWTLLFPIWTDR